MFGFKGGVWLIKILTSSSGEFLLILLWLQIDVDTLLWLKITDDIICDDIVWLQIAVDIVWLQIAADTVPDNGLVLKLWLQIVVDVVLDCCWHCVW